MLSKNAEMLLEKRYAHKGETPEGVLKRVAAALSIRDEKFEEKLYQAMLDGVFFPNSPAIRNAGRKRGLLHACFILPLEDNIGSIFDTIRNMAVIFKGGGGVGINFSTLRPKGAPLSSGGTSSGAISFMGIFDAVTETVKQGGFRRGALMGILNPSHPEIFDFCRAKLRGDLQNFNLSVMVTDDFMEKATGNGGLIDQIHEGKVYRQVRAKDIFDLIVLGSWVSGDPGMLFFDRINKDNKLYPEVILDTTNPCVTGDTLIAVADGRNAIPINILAQEGKDVPVYCKGKYGTTEVRTMRNIRKTGVGREVIKITFDDGTSVRCTSDHKFLMKMGRNSLAYRWVKHGKINIFNYKEAKDLKVGDSIERFDSIKRLGRRAIRSQRSFKDQYIMVYNYFSDTKKKHMEHIHHKDFDKTNDFFENLLGGLTPLEHSKFHDISGDKNPMVKLKKNPEKFELFREKQRLNGIERNPMTGQHQTEESKQKNREWHLGKPAWNKGLTKEMDERVARCGNHKVISIEFCGYEDVYDGEVDEFHNFGVISSSGDEKFLESSGVFVHNCSEVALPHYGACCLGSINISKFVEKDNFNFDKFQRAVKMGARALLNMNTISFYPLPQIRKQMEDLNPIGLGIMGFADTLIMLGIRYDSKEALDFIKQLSVPYIQGTDSVASDSFYKRIIAPTGSLSILADCSSGVEPVFAKAFERHLTLGVMEETRDIYKSEFCITAHQISPDWHLEIQRAWQGVVDGGISKTINMSADASAEDIKQVYTKAWKFGLKGVTIFRDSSIDGVLVSTERQKCDAEFCHL